MRAQSNTCALVGRGRPASAPIEHAVRNPKPLPALAIERVDIMAECKQTRPLLSVGVKPELGRSGGRVRERASGRQQVPSRALAGATGSARPGRAIDVRRSSADAANVAPCRVRASMAPAHFGRHQCKCNERSSSSAERVCSRTGWPDSSAAGC